MSNTRSSTNLIILTSDFIFCIWFFCELFWGNWNIAILRGIFYAVQGFLLLYFTLDILIGWISPRHKDTFLIYLFSLVIKLWLFAVILFGMLEHPVFCLFLYAGLMIVVSVMILFNDIWHGTFKDI